MEETKQVDNPLYAKVKKWVEFDILLAMLDLRKLARPVLDPTNVDASRARMRPDLKNIDITTRCKYITDKICLELGRRDQYTVDELLCLIDNAIKDNLVMWAFVGPRARREIYVNFLLEQVGIDPTLLQNIE